MTKINNQNQTTYLPKINVTKNTKQPIMQNRNSNETPKEEASTLKKLGMFGLIIAGTSLYSFSQTLNWPIAKGMIKRLLKIN